eukprot:2223712-Rhodomonas_salina.1
MPGTEGRMVVWQGGYGAGQYYSPLSSYAMSGTAFVVPGTDAIPCLSTDYAVSGHIRTGYGISSTGYFMSGTDAMPCP